MFYYTERQFSLKLPIENRKVVTFIGSRDIKHFWLMVYSWTYSSQNRTTISYNLHFIVYRVFKIWGLCWTSKIPFKHTIIWRIKLFSGHPIGYQSTWNLLYLLKITFFQDFHIDHTIWFCFIKYILHNIDDINFTHY